MRNLYDIKTAIVHDKLLEDGGSERVFLSLAKIFPKADIYTSLVNPKNSTFQKLRKRVKERSQAPIFVNKNANFLKPLINIFWESIDFSAYDLVISSSHSFSSKSILTRPKTIHICYCHTPPKFLYPELAESDTQKKFLLAMKRILFSAMRIYDFVAAQRPDVFIANSKEVQRRIQKYYRKDSVVIYPPVSVPSFSPKRDSVKDYYIYVGPVTEVKGLKIAINANNALGKKLVVIGEGRRRRSLERIAGAAVKFKGFVKEQVKINYLKSAKGFIFPAIDEDFGIAPVEAMAHGVPVIAYYSGGPKETIIEGKTGIFFREHSEEALVEAIRRFEKMHFDPNKCYRQAKKFSEERFKKEVTKFVEVALRERSSSK